MLAGRSSTPPGRPGRLVGRSCGRRRAIVACNNIYSWISISYDLTVFLLSSSPRTVTVHSPLASLSISDVLYWVRHAAWHSRRGNRSHLRACSAWPRYPGLDLLCACITHAPGSRFSLLIRTDRDTHALILYMGGRALDQDRALPKHHRAMSRATSPHTSSHLYATVFISRRGSREPTTSGLWTPTVGSILM